MLLLPRQSGEMPVEEGILASGTGDGGRQLWLDSALVVGLLATEACWHGLCTLPDFWLWDFYSILKPNSCYSAFSFYLASYQAFFLSTL